MTKKTLTQETGKDSTISPSSDCPLCNSPDTYLQATGEFYCEDCGHHWEIEDEDIKEQLRELDETWEKWQ